MHQLLLQWGLIQYQVIKCTYDDGFRKGRNLGYADAKNEFKTQALESIKTTIGYADRNLLDLKSESCINPKYVSDSLKLIVLPKWRLTVFGDDYVVRATMKEDHKNAWIMPEKESIELDIKLRKIVEGFERTTSITTDDISKMEREARIQMYKAITSVAKIP